MKNRATLILIEQAVMVLVLAVVAAVCLQGFAWADNRAEENRTRDWALTQVQSAAETLKANRGDLTGLKSALGGTAENSQWTLHFADAFVLSVIPKASVPYLGSAEVVLRRSDGTVLAALEVHWQEDGL